MNKYQEALNEIISFIEGDCDIAGIFFEYNNETYEAIDTMKELVGIATPERLQQTVIASNDIIETKAYTCPKCKGIVDNTDAYCKHCGQKFEEWI